MLRVPRLVNEYLCTVNGGGQLNLDQQSQKGLVFCGVYKVSALS